MSIKITHLQHAAQSLGFSNLGAVPEASRSEVTRIARDRQGMAAWAAKGGITLEELERRAASPIKPQDLNGGLNAS